MYLSFLFNLTLITTLIATPVFANSTGVEPVKVLVFGDSLTSGYGLEQSSAFPARLEKSLRSEGYAVKVVNAGVAGDTSAGGLARLEWSLASQPEVVIVELGANDALRGLDPAQTYKNLTRIIERLNEAGCRVILAGMQAPRNMGPDYYTKFDQIYPALAERHELLFYPFFLEGVATHAELNQSDGIHPNSAGVHLIVSGIQPLVVSVLDEIIKATLHE
jgi:acyl-CoA thioesterase-1